MAGKSRLALMLIGCGIAAVWPAAASAKSYPSKVLTDQSGNSMTKVYVGESVEIQLKAQPGTGFSWVPRKSAFMVRELSPMKPGRMVPGGAQMQRFLFKAKRPGIYNVSFSYDQPWSGGTKKGKTRSFTIAVR